MSRGNYGKPAFGRLAGDALWLLAAALLIYAVYAAFRPLRGVGVTLPVSLRPLPLYALFSFLRMLAAYALALVFSMAYGYSAAMNRGAGRVLLPLLDVLQSIPVLGFFPAAVYFFVAAFRGSRLGVEAASVFLIFTSQVWNMTFGVYESLTTIPDDLLLVSRAYGLTGRLGFRSLVFPACVTKLVYNSMLSWAGGWYFLIACEIIALGPVSVSLPGLGSYLIKAAESGDFALLVAGLATLVSVIWLMDYAVWRPLGVVAERYKYEYGGGSPSGRAALRGFRGWTRRPLNVVVRLAAVLAGAVLSRVVAIAGAVSGGVARAIGGVRPGGTPGGVRRPAGTAARWGLAVAGIALAAGMGWVLWSVLRPPWPPEARLIPAALIASALRLGAAYVLSLLWTLPAAVYIGRNERAYERLMPVFQVAASVPATALFPFIILLIVRTTGSMSVASVVLVLTGMQWYLLFNLVGAVRAIPADLLSVARAYGIRGRLYASTVLIPALIPSLVTGSITAWGGGWNALIVSEYVVYAGKTFEAFGIGALLDRATYSTGDFKTIWLSLVAMVVAVVASNRLFWRPLYDYAARRYRIEY
ncbi:MAG: ABC transporter permease subunit [Ignavibacteriales bacterium]